MADKQKEKIGLYKTLLTLCWTTFIVLSGGAYKLYSLKQYILFKWALAGDIILIILIFGFIFKTQKWIKKMEIKKQ